MRPSTLFILLLSCITFDVFGNDTSKVLYQKAYEEQHQMLKGAIPIDFARAVFITENSYHQGKLNYEEFKKEIVDIGSNLKKFIVESEMSQYKTAGNWAVFTFMTEGLEINNNKAYTYDFEDYFGEKDMSKMFVTKLMDTKSGNCHSLPYLYKILCDELAVESHLAIAPNHIYIKHISENGRWTNVELTNACFPEDKWMIKELAISKKALTLKSYLQPLSDKESIAMTLFDLANNYESQFGMDKFYLSVIDTALLYFPNCIPLLMNKSNFYVEQILVEQSKIQPNKDVLEAMQNNQLKINAMINELGHQEMPAKQYEKYLKYMEKEKKQLKNSTL